MSMRFALSPSSRLRYGFNSSHRIVREAMAKQDILNERVPPYEERRRQLESEKFPDNIGALLDEATAAVPDREACVFFESDETLSYRELRHKVNRLAHGLASI